LNAVVLDNLPSAFSQDHGGRSDGVAGAGWSCADSVRKSFEVTPEGAT
jgi:hypothetical protein